VFGKYLSVPSHFFQPSIGVVIRNSPLSLPFTPLQIITHPYPKSSHYVPSVSEYTFKQIADPQNSYQDINIYISLQMKQFHRVNTSQRRFLHFIVCTLSRSCRLTDPCANLPKQKLPQFDLQASEHLHCLWGMWTRVSLCSCVRVCVCVCVCVCVGGSGW